MEAFTSEKPSQAEMLGSAPFVLAQQALGAEFPPREQAGAAAGAANCRFEEANADTPKTSF